MNNIAAYSIDNHSVNEVYKPTDPEEEKQLSRPYSERLLEQMNIKILNRYGRSFLFVFRN